LNVGNFGLYVFVIFFASHAVLCYNTAPLLSFWFFLPGDLFGALLFLWIKTLSYRTFFRSQNEKTFDTKNKNPCFATDCVSPVK